MVRARLAEPDAAKGFILDGFPRTLPQADALDIMLDELGVDLDAVVEFAVPDDVVVERLLGRGRSDDTEDVIRNRQKVYRDETAPLLDHYHAMLVSVDAVGSVEEITERLADALPQPRERPERGSAVTRGVRRERGARGARPLAWPRHRAQDPGRDRRHAGRRRRSSPAPWPP